MLIMVMNVNRSYAFREERIISKTCFFLSYSLDGRRQRHLVVFVVDLIQNFFLFHNYINSWENTSGFPR